jgi:hyperosmotically inducible periplasmic protein
MRDELTLQFLKQQAQGHMARVAFRGSFHSRPATDVLCLLTPLRPVMNTAASDRALLLHAFLREKDAMKTLQLLCSAAAAVAVTAGAACNRSDTNDRAQQAANQVREVAARAGDELADAWTTTQIQAKYFADRDIKARYIDVSTHDHVVSLEGYVQNDEVRQRAVQMAKGASGVRGVQDRLLIGQAPQNASKSPAPSESVATSGAANAVNTAAARLDDGRITTMIQAKFFLDATVKGRRIDVDTTSGVVTLRGDVASDAERSQALRLARETDGVQRVEDMLAVNASLDRSGDSGTDNRATQSLGTRIDDSVIVTKLRAKFLADAEMKGASVEVAANNGVVTLEGPVANAAAHDRALALTRDTDGVVQVVDRLSVQNASTRAKARTRK